MLKSDQGLLAHTPLNTGVLQTIFYREKKIVLKFSKSVPVTLG